MKNTNADMLVIGGSAAGMVAAVTAKGKHPDKGCGHDPTGEQAHAHCLTCGVSSDQGHRSS